MVKKINVELLDAGRLVEILGVVIHNDAGSMTPEQYIEWLRNRPKELGIAHYYITKHCIARVIHTYNIGYHTGEWKSNQRYIGYEVCQSMKASDTEFLENEDMTLMQATEDLLFYGLPINRNTVRLHHEFVSTTCPHRSLALHGRTTESVRSYFIERMKYFSTLGKTVDEMLEKYNKPVQETPKKVKWTWQGGAHVQNVGWTERHGNMIGTTGQSLRLEAFYINIYKDGVLCKVKGKMHLQDIGDVYYNTNLFGTAGESRRLEAILLETEAPLQYRVHIEELGWGDWVNVAEWAGTKGKSKRIEAIEFRFAE